MPVLVIWSRGNKKASTKKRLLNENVNTAVIDEKFQINTQIEMDETGKPCKPKMSALSVVSDKARGMLGKAELDLSKFSQDAFWVHKLPLTECSYEGAFIEVGLKGGEAPKKATTATPAAGNSNEPQAEKVARVMAEFERANKDKQKLKEKYAADISVLKEKLAKLETDYENQKTELMQQARKISTLESANREHEKLLESLNNNLKEKKAALEKLERDIAAE